MSESPNILEEIAAIPLDVILDTLASGEGNRNLYLGLAQVRAADAAPRLLGLLTRAVDGEALSKTDERLLFFGTHILGGARNPAAFAPLMRLLRRPATELDMLFGDAIPETLPRIVAGVFDGDVETLFGIAADAAVDLFVRQSLLGAIAFLTWDGRIDAALTHAFFERFYDERLGDSEDDADGVAWDAWQNAVAMLGWRDLSPRVEAAFRDGRIYKGISTIKDYQRDLTRAEKQSKSYARFTKANLGYIEDIGEALEWLPPDYEEFDSEPDSLPPSYYAPQEPVINPFRHVGRNDPCPCGSGKKAKKCCLANQ
jgi:hypothetical protein